MKTLGKIALGIFLIGLGLILAGFIAGGSGAIGHLTPDDYTLVDETYDVGTLTMIELVFANKRIDIVPATDDQIRIVYYVTEDNPVVVTRDDTILTFEEEVEWVFQWFDFGWFWGVSEEYFDCTLYLPAEAILALDLSTSNGHIECSDLPNLTAIVGYTSNGAIALSNLSVSGGISIVSSNGAFNVENVTAGGTVTLRSSNGRIDVNDLTAGGDVILKTSNGPVDVDGLSADNLEVDTSNGAIDVAIVGAYEEFKILMETSNGSMYIDGEERNDGRYNTSLADTIDLDTSNGSIRLNFID